MGSVLHCLLKSKVLEEQLDCCLEQAVLCQNDFVTATGDTFHTKQIKMSKLAIHQTRGRAILYLEDKYRARW
jgi:hypothetical protein